MFVEYNPNPLKKHREDCIIRAFTKVLEIDWDTAYMMLVSKGFAEKEMPSINWVWGAVLRDNGFERRALPNTCPDCYTVENFCKDNPKGAYILATGTHVIAVLDGNYYDTWDSGEEVPLYYFRDTAEWAEETAKGVTKQPEGGVPNGK